MNDNTVENPDVPTPGISLQDLQIVINIIDICTKRGSFEGNELLIVGQTREKIVNFVKANTPATSKDADADTEAETQS